MRIFKFDLETSPNIAYTWGKYDQNVPEFLEEWKILSFAYQWNDESVKCYGLPDFPLYRKDKKSDEQLVRKLYDLMEQADVVVAHNGDDFDIKRANARFLFYGLNPPHHFKSVDTLKILRRHFSFNSNKLDDVSQLLGFGKKVKHEGIGLWIKCLAGDRKAWRAMKKYNSQDVVLLHKLYKYLLPWIDNHPNYNLYDGAINKCPNCGKKLVKAGFYYTNSNRYQSYRCYACGARPRDTKPFEKLEIKVK